MNDYDECLYQGFVEALWNMINQESMYTSLDRFDRKDANAIAKALRDVASKLIEESGDEG